MKGPAGIVHWFFRGKAALFPQREWEQEQVPFKPTAASASSATNEPLAV